MTEETTTLNWKTKLFNAMMTVKTWAQQHPGFSIPLAAYLAGLATRPIVKLIWAIL